MSAEDRHGDEIEPGRLEELFSRALDLPASERSGFLNVECAGSPAERAAVESLLAAHEGEDESFDRLDAARAAALLTAVHPEGESRMIGPYRIVREIGRGGMGTVFLAERVEGGFEQRVALKLVHPGLGTDAILERFRQERQILARLEHPGIARLIDGGVTEDGQPYFAMEHVDGESITAYVTRRRLPLRARLRLFEQVCEAVQRAHSNLVVHRDLKPSNVLVSDDGRVKLVDFGIAKVLEPSAMEGEPATRIGLFSLTPEYASPEQVRGEPVTTASDIYALGVLLYELLTGRLPYPERLSSPADIVHAVCETVPEPPSSVVPAGGTGERLDRDLDAICLKALAKERERRYGSVEALAEDVRRYLSGLPVVARPPSAAYRAHKFVRRHRWGVAAAAAAALALIVGLAGTAWQATVAAAERDRAAAEATKAVEIQNFLTSLLQSVDPSQTGAPWTAEELLDRGVERIDGLPSEQPEVTAHLLGVMGGVSGSLGEYARAESLWRRSLALRRRHPGAQDRELSAGLRGLASVLRDQSQFKEAERLLREALTFDRRAARTMPGSAEGDLAATLQNLGGLMQETSRLEEAGDHFREALALRRLHFGTDQAAIAGLLNDLGSLARARGELEEAATLLREALAIERESMGEGHPSIGITLSNLASTLAAQGDYDEAGPLYREALAISRKTWGEEDHPEITNRLSNLAQHLRRMGDFEEAAELFREVLELDRLQLGDEHPYVAFSLDNLAATLTELGRLDEALDMYRAANAILLPTRGADSPDTAVGLVGQAVVLRYRGEPERGLPLLEAARSIYVEALGSGHWREVDTLIELAAAHAVAGRDEVAEATYREALALHPESHRNLARARLAVGLGRLLVTAGREAEARPYLEQAVSVAREVFPAGHPNRHDAELAWAAQLVRDGDQAGADALAVEVLEQLAGRSDVHTERLRREAGALAAGRPPR